MKPNKNEIITAISEKSGLTKRDTEAVFNAAFDYFTEALAAGNEIAIPSFGTFKVKHRAERTGRNPRTKETITIPATKVVAFKSSSVLTKKVAE